MNFRHTNSVGVDQSQELIAAAAMTRMVRHPKTLCRIAAQFSINVTQPISERTTQSTLHIVCGSVVVG